MSLARAVATWNTPQVDETYCIDNMFVRKWCNPEPTHGAWGSEEVLLGPLWGDINSDRIVDVEDLRILGENYGKTQP